VIPEQLARSGFRPYRVKSTEKVRLPLGTQTTSIAEYHARWWVLKGEQPTPAGADYYYLRPNSIIAVKENRCGAAQFFNDHLLLCELEREEEERIYEAWLSE